jgi:predicted cupin superfamily sugar epimerase
MILDEQGLREVLLGRAGPFHAVVPAGCWQAAEPRAAAGLEQGYALVGCTVAPPFTFERFEMGTPELLERWPAPRQTLARWLR